MSVSGSTLLTAILLSIVAETAIAETSITRAQAIEFARQTCDSMGGRTEAVWHAKLQGHYWYLESDPNGLQTMISKQGGIGKYCAIAACIRRGVGEHRGCH